MQRVSDWNTDVSVRIVIAEPARRGTLELLRLPGIYLIVGKARTETTGGTEGSTVPHIGFAVKDLAAVKATDPDGTRAGK